jgi:hypothetical protein
LGNRGVRLLFALALLFTLELATGVFTRLASVAALS